MATLGAIAGVIVVPALLVLYREFFPGVGVRASALLVGAVCLGAGGTWLLTGLVVPGVGGTALQAPTFALAVIAALLGIAPMGHAARAPVPALLHSTGWTALVFVPVVLVVFYPAALGLAPLDAPLDLGGVLPVHIAAGCAALVAIRSRRELQQGQPRRRPSGRVLFAAGALLWGGWTLLLVGLELDFGEATMGIAVSSLIAPPVAVIGWLSVQRILAGTTTVHGALAGMVCGLVAVTPGGAFLTPAGAAVAGAAAGVIAAAFVLRRVSRAGDAAWFLVGAHWVAGVVGLVALGIIGIDRGFMFTGHLGILQAQLFAIALVSVWAGLVSFALWSLARVMSPLQRIEEVTSAVNSS